jgi:hypothetical protein
MLLEVGSLEKSFNAHVPTILRSRQETFSLDVVRRPLAP